MHVAKDEATHAILLKMFARREIRKHYAARSGGLRTLRQEREADSGADERERTRLIADLDRDLRCEPRRRARVEPALAPAIAAAQRDPWRRAERVGPERTRRERGASRDGEALRMLDDAGRREAADLDRAVNEAEVELAGADERELSIAARMAKLDLEPSVFRAQRAQRGG